MALVLVPGRWVTRITSWKVSSGSLETWEVADADGRRENRYVRSPI